jgi:hypothetical protein
MLFGYRRIIHLGEVGLSGVDRQGHNVYLSLSLMRARINGA